MADKKKLKKEIKLLRKRVKKAMERNLKAQQELGRLQTKMAKRAKQTRDPSGTAVEDALEQSLLTEDIAGAEDAGLASAHRATWKKHTYLRDRYEVHLGEGQGKPNARKLANLDLVAKYGEESGFSEEDLQDILT